MLHLSNKGSKKSYAAKAACLTAGLVAVFASSSVFALTLKCRPTGDLLTAVAAAAPGAAANRTFTVSSAGGEGTYTVAELKGKLQARMMQNCTVDGVAARITQKGQAIEVSDASTGAAIFGITLLLLANAQ